MKYLITITIFLSNLAYSQQQKFVTENDSVRFKNCDEGIVEAKTDFKNGIYNSISYGMIIQTNVEFDEFVANYRKEKYGIISKMGGCVVTPYTDCYSEKMQELILKKFGKNIFEKSEKEAEKLYAKQSKKKISKSNRR